jgi:hypothetical protein
MSNAASRTYSFQEDDPKDIVNDVLDRYKKISYFMNNRGIMSRWVKSFNSYYGFYYADPKAAYGMGNTGPQGELTTVAVNQFRNLIQHTLVLFTQNKVSFDVIPMTSDIEGRNASIVGNSTLEYIFQQTKYSQELYKMAEVGLVLGTSFLKIDWRTNKNLVGVGPDMKPVFSGELNQKTYLPLDVILEPFKENFEDQEWVGTREIVNKFDLISKYPEMRDEILNLSRVQDVQLADPYFITDDNSVWLYKVYHKSTMAVPFGRYLEFSSDECIYEDYKENPYCDTNPETMLPIMGTGIPIVCFRPATTYGSAWGHTVAFDLLPLQDAKNLLSSTIVSNQAAYGVQNLIVGRGTNFDFADVAVGLRVCEYDPNPELGPTGGAPQTLELLKTPPEIFSYNNKLDEEMEKISGINGALRGTPPPQVGSGTAMALLTTQAQTFNTQVENAYINCIQDVATFSLKTIAKFMSNTDLVEIVGLKENYAIPSFKAEELKKISKVKVLTGNAISKSPAGRLAMAQDMLNSGQITPTQYTEVAQTGSLKNDMEDVTAEDALIVSENQMLMQGQDVIVLQTDNHLKHIKQHLITLTHPEVRNDKDKQANIMKHLVQHQQFWVVLGTQNPQLLALITGSPIPPDVPNPGVVAPGAQQPPAQPPQGPGHPPGPPQMHGTQQAQGSNPIKGVAKNNLQNASTPGGNVDLAASAIRSAQNLMQHGRK